jgi:signal transduction histidine kinase/ActR/RegA family two-component response regulator
MNTLLLTIIFFLLAGYAGLALLYFVIIRPQLRCLQASQSQPSAPSCPGEAAPEPLPVAGAIDDAATKNETLPQQALRLALQRSLNEWWHTFDAVIDPILILDTDLTIVKGNRAAVQLLSVDGAGIEGKKCYQLFAGSETPCPRCPIQSVCRELKTHKHEVTHRYIGRTLAVSCAPIISDAKIVGFVHSAKDVSHQRNLEKRLVHASKLEAISTLAGGIAHDFNNILGAILGNADLLLYRLPIQKAGDNPFGGPPITYEEIADHIQAIKRAGNRAKDLVGQILAFSRQATNQRRNLLIAPVVKEVCRLLRASFPATIELKVSVAQDIGMIYADPGQIQQVLMNLCTNAAQALENEVGVIEVSLREIETGKAEQLRYSDLEPGKYVVLTVKDTGGGIPPETLERIFDPFFTTKEVGEGSGLGLAVIHGIIISHDGVIDVKSELGRGSVFTVFFPRVQEADGEADEMVSLPRGTETILFVDDEEDIVKMRTGMLSYLGYRMLPATSPEQALGYFTKGKEQIDLLITDHTMPRMTGLQLATRINAMQPDLPIILCSGYSEAVTPEEAQKAGIHRFLAKPVDMRLLATAIREILPNKDREAQ